VFDGVARHVQEESALSRKARMNEFRAAIGVRDESFGDYGQQSKGRSGLKTRLDNKDL